MSSMNDASVDVLFDMFYRLTVQNALTNQQQTIYWLFTQPKESSIYRYKPIVTYWI